MFSGHGYGYILFFLATISVSSISAAAAPTNSTDPILYDIYPFIRVYKNGRIQRFIGQGYLPPSIDPSTGVHSKDVKFSQTPNLTARLYLPKTAAASRRKLPLLIYFHGGGFFTESAFSPTYHNHLNSLVAKSGAIAVSVNYRLAPEHPLPTAYEDSWLALQWTFSHLKGNGRDPWLKNYADFDNFYLGGDSAGANLAHNMAIRIGLHNPGIGIGITLKGMFLNCPFFLGKKPIGNESTPAYAYSKTLNQRLWLYAYPNSPSGLDDPLVNPGTCPLLKTVPCKRVLVYVAGDDVLKYRGWYYKQVLEKSGWNGEIKVAEFAGEVHDFNLVSPARPSSARMLKSLASFLNH